MERITLGPQEELEKPFSDKPPIENLHELYNEAEEKDPEVIENKNIKEQEELNKIWAQIGPRIP